MYKSPPKRENFIPESGFFKIFILVEDNNIFDCKERFWFQKIFDQLRKPSRKWFRVSLTCSHSSKKMDASCYQSKSNGGKPKKGHGNGSD